MKTLIILTVFCFFWISLVAQAPQAFKYQAVARNSSGEVLANQSVSFRISILNGSASGTLVYSETHSGKTTNAFGLVDMEIGKGTPVTGTFISIPWNSGTYYLKVEMDPAGSSAYQTLGASQLLSVPYALHAKTVEIEADGSVTNEIQTLSLSGTQLTLSKEGGTVILPTSGGGDNWGTDVVKTDATLDGNGTAASPLKIAQQSASSGKVLKWDGIKWAPGDDITATGFTLPYAGTANDPTASLKITNTNTTAGSAGIYGINSSITGKSFGIFGESFSTTGYGVYGKSPYIGVLGYPTTSSGANFGIVGETNSDAGYAVGGYAYSQSGINCGVMGYTNSSSGVGVKAHANSTTGTNYGVYSLVLSPSGFSGYFTGGKFYVSGNTGIGIENPGAKLEVNGQVKITGGAPGAGKVLTSDATGLASWQTAANELSLPYAGSTSIDGIAFHVNNSNLSGTNSSVAISGHANKIDGIGVWGSAGQLTGACRAIYGSVNSSDGFSGYFSGGKFYVNGNVGIGTDNPGAKLEVNGQVKITGGNPGAGKVLTSDAAGMATWATPGGFSLPFAGTGSSDLPVFSVSNTGIGNGIHAVSNITTGIVGGVIGESHSISGSGVIGNSYATSGTTYGIKGKVYSSTGYSGYFEGGRFYADGNFGIGDPAPSYKLDVTGNRIRLKNGLEWIAMRTDGNVGFLDLSFGGGNLVIQGSATDENIIINPSMNKVGIRTWSPQYELDVNGNIRATGSVYYGGTPTTNGTAYTKPDYVFGENYEKLNTAQVGEFLNSENHLPWVTSVEEEKKENGGATDMTRMAFETLEAVENLQLQLITQDKLIREMKAENELLKNRLEKLEKLIASSAQK